MNDFIGIDIQGLPEVKAMMDRLAPAIHDAIIDRVAGYVVNVLQNDQPTPNHNISRAMAYPEVGGWFSKKQRRWFFWALRTGRLQLPYKRTQATRRAWVIIGKGKDAIIVNETAGALFTRDDERQSRHEALVGWQKISAMLEERSKAITRQAVIGANEGIRKARKS
jgi:hypothetical protein